MHSLTTGGSTTSHTDSNVKLFLPMAALDGSQCHWTHLRNLSTHKPSKSIQCVLSCTSWFQRKIILNVIPHKVKYKNNVRWWQPSSHMTSSDRFPSHILFTFDISTCSIFLQSCYQYVQSLLLANYLFQITDWVMQLRTIYINDVRVIKKRKLLLHQN